MSARVALLGCGLVLLTAGCGPTLLGARCERSAECLRGARCIQGVCELPGPCSARIERRGKDTTSASFSYDAQGRPLRDDRVGRDGAKLRQLWRWEGDRSTLQLYDEHQPRRPDLTIITTWDEDERMLEQRVGVSADEFVVRVNDWSDRSCREPPTAAFHRTDNPSVPTGRLETDCRPDGQPLERRRFAIEGGESQLFSRARFRYDSDGRLVELRNESGLNYERSTVRLTRFVRDDRGVTIGLTTDLDADGEVDEREIWDLGCWETTGDNVQRR